MAQETVKRPSVFCAAIVLTSCRLRARQCGPTVLKVIDGCYEGGFYQGSIITL